VVKVNDAVWEHALAQEFELGTDVVRQGALAPTHHDRTEEQMAVLDQPGGDRLDGELGGADRNVGARGLFEPPDRIGIEIALDRALALDTV
jgi:hypothetical protein